MSEQGGAIWDIREGKEDGTHANPVQREGKWLESVSEITSFRPGKSGTHLPISRVQGNRASLCRQDIKSDQ